MDQPLFSSSSIPYVENIIIIILVLFLATIISYKKSKPGKKLPPGPWRLPIIGNMHQVLSSLPHQNLAKMAKRYGPVMNLQLGQMRHLVLSSPEAAMELMKNHDLEFSERPVYFSASVITYKGKDIAFGTYGDYWRWLRKISIIGLLSTKKIQSCRYIRDDEVSSIVESIRLTSSQGSTVDIRQMLFTLTSSITARSSFGKSVKQRNDVFAPLVRRMSQALGGFNIADFFPSIGFLPAVTGLKSYILKLYRDMDDILQSVIDERREMRSRGMVGDEQENLLDFLLNLQEHGGDLLEFHLTSDHIKAIVCDVFSAGIETSSTLLEWTLSELMANPTAMRKVQDEVRQAFKDDAKVDETRLHELDYFNSVLKETLRLHPPFAVLPRKARENVTLSGYEIPAGTSVFVNAWAIGRDPKYWTEPEKFRPERFLDDAIDYKGKHFQLIPFGAGRRMCAGMQFGMTNVEVPLASLLYHFDWELPNGMAQEDFDMSEVFGLTIARKNTLHLRPIPWSGHPKTEM